MMNKIIVSVVFLIIITQGHAQTNDLSGSPYSLYGLGVPNESNTGKTNSMGKTGIAMPSDNAINNLNPASYATIPSNNFFYDIGVKGQKETLAEAGNEEPRFNANFSNIAIAFPINNKSGMGITLIPYTNVGYLLMGIETEIEGSNDTFISNIKGSGGLNDLRINYAYRLTEKLRLGVSASYLFGKITEDERSFIGNTTLSIHEDNYYNGFKFGGGFQYDISKFITLGGVINFPVTLRGDQTSYVTQPGYEPIVNESDLDTFELPLEIGFGVHTKLKENLLLNIDYRRNFWDATNQTDQIGTYVDQDFIGIGMEYTPKKRGFKYWERIQYRAGFNMDNGNLEVDGERVHGAEFTLGIGLPMKGISNSMFNISYSYGQNGQLTNGLIQENYHTVTLNFSLDGIWFKRKKFQ
ncbi:OmpP1/FadL family transporter [Aquimarina hainanensis]|uniref:OmpP1/FadL family transporter n=1 Tax=Aquimarina hainanensis TaxID=1578017 RepID=A0ABW5NFC7_9FLAO